MGSGSITKELLHTHLLTKADYRSCGAYNEEGTGVTILNPLRSRAAERVADSFLRALSDGRCSPETNEGLCKAMAKRSLPATDWRLVYRKNFGNEVDLFYRLERATQECVIAHVSLHKASADWKVDGYGISY